MTSHQSFRKTRKALITGVTMVGPVLLLLAGRVAGAALQLVHAPNPLPAQQAELRHPQLRLASPAQLSWPELGRAKPKLKVINI